MIAGIADHGGGRRVVFTSDPMSIPANTMFAKGESYHVVPGFHPMHDIWNHKEWIIWKGEQAVIDATRDGCGACRACCITMFIFDEGDGFSKPSHTPCANLCNAGCRVNDKKPAACKRFECGWLQSQRNNDPMGADLRPDRCGSILTTDDAGTINIHTGRHVTEKSSSLDAWVKDRMARGWKVNDVTHYLNEP